MGAIRTRADETDADGTGSSQLKTSRKQSPMGTDPNTHMPLEVEIGDGGEDGSVRDGSAERTLVKKLLNDSSTPLHLVDTPFNEEAPSH